MSKAPLVYFLGLTKEQCSAEEHRRDRESKENGCGRKTDEEETSTDGRGRRTTTAYVRCLFLAAQRLYVAKVSIHRSSAKTLTDQELYRIAKLEAEGHHVPHPEEHRKHNEHHSQSATDEAVSV